MCVSARGNTVVRKRERRKEREGLEVVVLHHATSAILEPDRVGAVWIYLGENLVAVLESGLGVDAGGGVGLREV